MKINRIIGFLIIAVFIILNIVGFFILPETLVMQVNLSNEPSTFMPKWLGLILLMVLGSTFSAQLLREKNSKDHPKWYLVSFIILAVNIIVFIYNI